MRQEVGKQGERMAARYLEQNGYRVLAMNVKRAGCEIDIVAREGNELVFVEVKTRLGGTHGYPEESVTLSKRRHIARAAELYLAEVGDGPWRVDVIAIRSVAGQSEPEVIHFKGV